MKNNKLKLVEPSVKLKSAFLEMVRDYQNSPEKQYQKESQIPFEKYISDLDSQSKGINLQHGYVPATTYWLMKDNQTILGGIRLRHKLNAHLLKIGGHIGYDVPPSQRRKGYGSLMLKLALEKAKEIGLSKALLTCDKDNIASAKIIEKNGGVLENEIFDDVRGKIKKRYWINL